MTDSVFTESRGMATFPRKSGALSPSSSKMVTTRTSWMSLTGLRRQTRRVRLHDWCNMKYTCGSDCMHHVALTIKGGWREKVGLTMWRLYSTLGRGSYRWCGSEVCRSPVPAHRKGHSYLHNTAHNTFTLVCHSFYSNIRLKKTLRFKCWTYRLNQQPGDP